MLTLECTKDIVEITFVAVVAVIVVVVVTVVVATVAFLQPDGINEPAEQDQLWIKPRICCIKLKRD